LKVEFDAPPALPPLSKEAELALFRALQEGLSNVRRHAGARHVAIRLRQDDGRLRLAVRDNGHGPPDGSAPQPGSGGHMGLAGMRERIGALGGSVRFGGAAGAGAALEVELPLAPVESP
jgi:two-component system sensor histidine kinase UhpB